MLTKLEKLIDRNTQHCNKELETSKKTPSKINNSLSEIQPKAHIRRNKNSRLSNTEEHICDLEDRTMEITQSEQQKGKQFKK